MIKLLLVVLLFAVAVYAVVRAIERRGVAPTGLGRPRRPTRPLAPDDDPDFLRNLDQQAWEQRRRKRREQAQQGESEDPTG